MSAAGAGNLRIDAERYWNTLMEMATIGATPKGGCNRQTLTDLDREGRDLFKRWCEAAGCSVTVDEMGNMRALRAGKRSDLPPVVIGSHLDTQPTGGKFDGVAGVLAGLEIVRTLNDAGYETDHPIMVVNWTNEEGTRFAPAMLSSGVFAGAFSKEWAYARTDRDGKRFGEELERIGYKGTIPCAPERWKCHLELHIEQGPILEAEGKVIGVVTGAQGIRWYEVTIRGKESHAGSTPMPRRKDALVAASRVVDGLDRLAREFAPHAVATVGVLEIAKPSRNVIPGEVFFTIDLRHPDATVLDELDRRVAAILAEACARDGLPYRLDPIWYFPPVRFDESCIAAIRTAAIGSGFPWREMVSGPGHDSCYTARVVPTAMIFVPCRDGLSHNEEEWAEPEHLAAGCQVLLQAALALARAE
ncbi:MAG: Zn-dependent hydrolase [Geminicoccaceae bacterium]|nr:Zn-dependent hydrolase [Geminicoccaceae bacterium]MCX8100006.1 Zn-dependent hydrolase [Geminicoccaceae bacterium]MDW8370024.1 Zn-dependent hydrolase [Geminicoccaceae bacterium]